MAALPVPPKDFYYYKLSLMISYTLQDLLRGIWIRINALFPNQKPADRRIPINYSLTSNFYGLLGIFLGQKPNRDFQLLVFRTKWLRELEKSPAITDFRTNLHSTGKINKSNDTLVEKTPKHYDIRLSSTQITYLLKCWAFKNKNILLPN